MTSHPFRWFPFLFGLAFGAIAFAWTVLGMSWLTVNELGIIGPVFLIAAGIIGITATLWRRTS